MRSVLADLVIETEAAFRRLALAVAKYWVCKRGSTHTAEALECLGGNGYVEESGMPRLYREAPLLSIWEGSGNVVALDVLRALTKEPDGSVKPRSAARPLSGPVPPPRTRGPGHAGTRFAPRSRPASSRTRVGTARPEERATRRAHALGRFRTQPRPHPSSSWHRGTNPAVRAGISRGTAERGRA